MTRLRAALTALALAVTVLLTGCTQGAATTTAVVNGVVVRESTVDAIMTTLGDVSTNKAQAHSIIVVALVRGELARQIAKQKNITLAPADLAALSDRDPALAAFLATNEGRLFADEAAAWEQLKTELTADALEATVKAQDVQLNPRYGTWAASAASFSSGSGSLSEVIGA